MVLNKPRDGKAPVILAVNKVDNVQEKANLLPHLLFLASQINFLISCRSTRNRVNVDLSRQSCVSICLKRPITSRKITSPIAHTVHGV
ncbi:hypothetical protein ACLK1Z_14885 [Escherichia coli]